MTFYNPLFFNSPPFFNKQSTNNAKNVNNYHQNSALKPKSQNNYQASSTQFSKLTKNIDSQNIKFSEGKTNHIDNKKSNYKNPFNLGISPSMHALDKINWLFISCIPISKLNTTWLFSSSTISVLSFDWFKFGSSPI